MKIHDAHEKYHGSLLHHDHRDRAKDEMFRIHDPVVSIQVK